MANIVAEIMKMATPGIIDKIASSFGISSDMVRSVLTMAVPGLMGAIANKASTPSGASEVLSSLTHANSNLDPSMMSALAGSNASSLASTGTAMLGSLLGNNAVSSLSNMIIGKTGLPPAVGASVIGVAGQMVMSSLAKHSAGLDASGLGSLLSSQKSFIEQAMPAGLGNVTGSLSGAATSAAGAASKMKANVTAPAMPDAPGGMGWLKYAIPAALILLAAGYFLTQRGGPEATTEMAKPAVTTTAPAAPATPAMAPAAIMIDNIDITKNLTGALTDLTGSLGGITDVTTAQAALPKLQTAATSLTAISGLAAKFTPDQKTAVAAMVNAGLPAITAATTKVEGMAGVGDLVKPVLDGIIAQLTALSK